MSSLLERLRTALAPHYEVERELASGGMGTVFLARDPKLDRKVAIKILQPDLASETASERFLREARILAKLSHPNVVAVHAAGDADGVGYYVMEYVEGEALKERLERGAMPKDEVLKLADDLLSALEAAHERGIVHRDVKPSNIFLVGDRALLADFGIAKPSEDSRESLTASGHRVGTPGYMAPEQLVGDDVTPATDIYAAGMVIYEALTARRWSMLMPTEEADWSGVPSEIVPVMQRSLAWSPSDRWPDAPAFRKALTEPPAAAPRVKRRKSYRAVLLLASLAAIALVAGGLATGVGGGSFSLFAYAGAWASVMAGIWFLFEKAEEVVSPDIRGVAARWLRNLDPGGAVQTWPATFARVFDRIFGENHLTWRCFGRSCIASLISVLIVTIIWAALRPDEFQDLTALGANELLVAVIGFIGATAVLNFIIDYVSLLETRQVIRGIGSKGHLPFFLGVDFVATFAIVSVLLFALAPVNQRLDKFLFSMLRETLGPDAVITLDGRDSPMNYGTAVVETFKDAVSLSSLGVQVNPSLVTRGPLEALTSGERGEIPVGVWFYSTFFTSVWVWLYALAGLTVKAGGYAGLWVGRFKHVMDIDDQPLRSMGFVAMLIVTLVFLVALPFVAF